VKDSVIKDIRKWRKRERLKNPTKYNEGIRGAWIPFWAANARRNARLIEDRFDVAAADAGPAIMAAPRTEDCFIIGSGPSLDKTLPLLVGKEVDIWISSSHLTVCEAYGIKPKYCVIIDADPSMSFLVGQAKTEHITLITHPCMDPEILKLWKGPVLFFRMADPGDQFFNEIIPHMYAHGLNGHGEGIKTFVMNGGCVTNTAAALAQYAGYRKIYLAGVDLGFPGDQYRFTDYTRNGEEYVKQSPPVIPDHRKQYFASGDVWTDTVGVFYKYSMIVLWGIDGTRLISCSDGILKEYPWVSPEEAVQGKGEDIDAKVKYKRAQEYLRHRGIFIVKARPIMLHIKHKMRTYRALRKLVVRYTAWVDKRHGKSVYPMLRNFLKSTRIKVRVRKFVILLEHTLTHIGFDAFMSIQNVSALSKWKRPGFRLNFYLGKLIGRW